MKKALYACIAVFLGSTSFAFANPVITHSLETQTEYSYNRDAAVQYAHTWFALQNPAYYAYTQDCANFVSQCLLAGGIPENSAWYSSLENGDFLVGEPWRLAKAQYEYFSDSSHGFCSSPSLLFTSSQELSEKTDLIQPGDLLFTSPKGTGTEGIGHATIVTKVENGHVYITSHSCPKLNQDAEDFLETSDLTVVRIDG